MEPKQQMSIAEIYEFIDTQAQWTEEEKMGVRTLFSTYTRLSGYPKGSHMHERVERYHQQLAELGIIV